MIDPGPPWLDLSKTGSNLDLAGQDQNRRLLAQCEVSGVKYQVTGVIWWETFIWRKKYKKSSIIDQNCCVH